MSARAWAHPGHAFRWVFLAVIAVIGIAFAASAVLFVLRGIGVGPGWVFFPFGWFFVFLFFLFFWGFRWWGPWRWYGRPYGPYRLYREDGAKAILRERYARGEIGKDQLDEMMRDLERHT